MAIVYYKPFNPQLYQTIEKFLNNLIPALVAREKSEHLYFFFNHVVILSGYTMHL